MRSGDPAQKSPSTTSAGSPSGPTLFLSSNDVEQAFSWSGAAEILRRFYGAPQSEAMFPPRTMARGDGVWLRTLSGVLPDGSLMGAKLISVSLSRKRASYLIPLFDQASADLVALLDGNCITGYRTAATTAMAVDALTRPGAVRVGVLGTGFEARNHVRALAAIRTISSIEVFSPNPDSRAAFIRDLADLGIATAQAQAAQAVVEAAPDILLCAARSRGEAPLFDGRWLSPGMTIASIGSTLPEQREVDAETVARAKVIVADMPDEVSHDTGDMREAREAGIAFDDKLVALTELIGGRHPGRRADSDIVLYKSVGAAIQDIAVAAMCLDEARKKGLGTPLSATIQTITK